VAEGLSRVEGRGCVLRGDDIDTDRIIPARYLRCVTFDGIGEHAFADDRKQAKGDHPLDDARFRGASILIVGRNFGCGSSREHAPQSLWRFGFQAFVGASFAEIFAGNCTALGLPCVTLGERDLEALMDSVSLDPGQPLVIDLAARTLTSRAGTVKAGLRDGVRKALLEGSWNATAVLIDAGDAIERAAARLPYVSGFAARGAGS
jgi:3-isopropylmalate/(R)-2-methylmalate dehydratase small subunit